LIYLSLGMHHEGAGAHTASCESRFAVRHPRWEPYAPNWARADLCGGREVTCVPTAKDIYFRRLFLMSQFW
jgi:hypothetical protein